MNPWRGELRGSLAGREVFIAVAMDDERTDKMATNRLPGIILDSSVGRARLSYWQRAWGRCASLRAVARHVVTLAGRSQARGLASSCRSIVRRHN